MGKPPRYVGVRFDKGTGRYEARFGDAFLGRYPSARDAAVARDRAILHARAKARLSFPELAKTLGPAAPEHLRARARAERRQERGLCHYGVRKVPGGYEAHVSVARADVRLGHFKRARDAAIAHDRAQLYVNPGKGFLNFPRMKLSPASPTEIRREAREALKSGTTSRYEGTGYDARDLERPWEARIMLRRCTTFLGRWASERDAALARDRAALHYLGPRARLNFPGSRAVPADAETLLAEARGERKQTTLSRFLGVTFHKGAKKWAVQFAHRRIHHYIGLFESEIEAARAYDREVASIVGKRARLNFHPVTGAPVFGRRLGDLTSGARPPKAAERDPPPSGDRSSRASTSRARSRRRGRRA